MRAADGGADMDVQSIDAAGKFCAASDALATSQYRWAPGGSAPQATAGVSGQCQLYPGARYTSGWWGGGGYSFSAQYIMSP